jgi:hypothetical protein
MRLTWSPWGAVQTQKEIAPGIVSVSTSSHGGIFVSPELRDRLVIQDTAYSRDGWFEEDCDWSFVALSFPEHFGAEYLAAATAGHVLRV